jgi:hypothetical protein
MKKNLIKSALVLSIAAMITACGGNNNETQAPAGNSAPANNATTTQPANNVETETVAPSANGVNYDQIIDDYSSLVDQMIEMNKKIEAGDMSAMDNYQSLMQKSNKFSEDCQKASTENLLTSKQLRRLQKIMSRLDEVK